MEDIKKLVKELGVLSARKKIIEDIISKKQEELIDKIKVHGKDFVQSIECERCDGGGYDEDGLCISCDGDGERFIFSIPTCEYDLFSCKIYEVTKRIGSQNKARTILSKDTFKELFKPQGHRRIDIRPTSYGQVSIGQSNGN